MEPKIETSPRLRFLDENGQAYPEWEEKRLGEVAKIRIGFTPSTSNSSYWGGENQWLAVSGINSRRTNKGTKTISNEATNGKQPFPPGTLLMSFKLSVGKLTITDIPIYTNEAICGFELSNDIQRDYLMYALEISDLTKGSERAVKGITLNKAKIVQIPIPLPSLPEQEKIGEFLSFLDTEVEQAERLVSLLSDRKKAYAQRIFDRTLRFHDDNDNPYPKWEEKRLGEVAKIRIGFTPSTSNSSYWGGENQWLAVSGINSRRTNKGTKTISNEATNGKQPFPPGTLLMSFKLSVGKLTITDIPIYTNEAICGFELSNDIQRDYLMYALEISDLTKGSERAVKGITLNKAKIVQIPIPLPSLPEQEKIGSFLSSLDDEIDEAKRELGLLKERKKAYAQKIFGV